MPPGGGVKPKEESAKPASRMLRHDLSRIGNNISNKRDDYLSLNNDHLTQEFQLLNRHSEKVSRAPDQALESGIFRDLISVTSDKVTRFCASTSAVAPIDVAKALVDKYGKPPEEGKEMQPENFNWVKFGEALACSLFRGTCCAQVDFMMGSVKPPALRNPVVRRQRAREPVTTKPTAKPSQLDVSQQDDSNETSKLTEEMFARVKSLGRTPYSFLVLNPESFAQTVENMFSISMLVTQSKVALRSHDDWGMSVELARQEKSHSTGHVSSRERETKNTQMILNMNFGIWEAMKARVSPDDCCTPHRDAIECPDPQHAGKRTSQSVPHASQAKRARHS